VTETRLGGRVAVITGSASGIGREIAIRLADEGASIVVSDVRADPREGGESTEAVITGRGGTCLRFDADVSRWDDVDRLVSAAVERFGRLDVMVNNAGITGTSPTRQARAASSTSRASSRSTMRDAGSSSTPSHRGGWMAY
jgi:NAD(P)-dependent dehydrogenase (short-subunit alcohol dehydrogenase family)